MASLRRFFLRLLNACGPLSAEPDLDRELASHLRLLEDDYQQVGCRRKKRTALRNEHLAASSTPRIATVMLDRLCGSTISDAMRRMRFARHDRVLALPFLP